MKKKIENARRCLREAQADAGAGVVNREFVDRYIDRISALPADRGTMNLQIKLFNGTILEKAVHKR